MEPRPSKRPINTHISVPAIDEPVAEGRFLAESERSSSPKAVSALIPVSILVKMLRLLFLLSDDDPAAWIQEQERRKKEQRSINACQVSINTAATEPDKQPGGDGGGHFPVQPPLARHPLAFNANYKI